MTMAAVKHADGVWYGSARLRWVVCFVLVLCLHASALLVLRRAVPALGSAPQEAIMIDLAPEPATPPGPLDLQQTPEPPVPLPNLPPMPPEPVPVPDPDPVPPEPAPPLEPDPPPPLIQDLSPPVPQAELPLPPAPRPHVPRPPPRPRPTAARPAVESSAIEAPVAQVAPFGPAAAAPPGQVEAAWEGQLLAHLARFKRFPPAAERRGEQGVVLMRLIIARDGRVLSMAMTRGSGYADLDNEAQAWLTRAQPLPAFPPRIMAQQMEIMVPLRFTLR
jgi:periplasmic protein TonB